MGGDGVGLNIGIVWTALVYTVCIRSLYSAAVDTVRSPEDGCLESPIIDRRSGISSYLARHSLTLLLYDEQLSDLGEIIHNESLTPQPLVS
jgi:hypothetical protein